jgi:hypothetical protein
MSSKNISEKSPAHIQIDGITQLYVFLAPKDDHHPLQTLDKLRKDLCQTVTPIVYFCYG